AGWKYPRGWSFNDDYFALEHYSRFIQPGFQRVDAQLKDRVARMSAFMSPDGTRVVAVLLNPTLSDDSAVRLGFGDFVVGNSTVYRSDFSGSTERFALVGALGADSVVALPRQSVVTVVADAAAGSR